MSVPVDTNGDTNVSGANWVFRKKPTDVGDSVHRANCDQADKSVLSVLFTPQGLASEASDHTIDCALSEVQTHYILQSIIAFEMHREWSGLACLGGLTKYGIPYESAITATISPHTNGGASPGFNPAAIPDPHLLRLLFRQHILTFPGTDIAPRKYWTKRIQPWFDGMALLGLSTSIERGVPTKRQQLSFLLTRLVGTYFSRGIGVVSPNSVSTLGQESAARPGDKETNAVDEVFPGMGPQGCYIGVVDAPNQKNMFIVASQKKGEKMMFVLHSQNAFETLARELQNLTRDCSIHLPIYNRIHYSANTVAVHLQTYIRAAFALGSQLSAGASVKLDAFLTNGVKELSSKEKSSARQAIREQDAKLLPLHRAWIASGKKVDEIQGAWREWIAHLIKDPKGLDTTWEMLATEKCTNLPPREQLCIKKAAIWVADVLHGLFVTGPNAKELNSWVRWILALVPWWPLRQLLRITDPSKMIAALLSLILARPFGTQSLLQRLVSSMFGSQASRCRKEAKIVEHKIVEEAGTEQGRQWFNAINEYVFKTSLDEREAMRARTAQPGEHLVSLITGADTISSSLVHHLQKLLSLLSMSRDYDSLIQFCSSPPLVKVIKDTLSVVLYVPLTEWSKVCRLNDRVYDLQIFLDDLVNTARGEDKSNTAFIALAERHQQSLYFLFHEAHVKGGNLMDPLREWCRRALKYMRSSSLDLLTADSPQAQVDIERLVSHASVNREALIREVDEIIHWAKWRKLRWHIRMRRNVLMERGAVGLAQRVDVDEIIQFASRVLGVETQEETARDSIEMDESGASIASSPTAAQDTLRDHYSWAWFSDPAFSRMLDEALSTGSLPRQPGPTPPRPTELRKLVAPFLQSIESQLSKAHDISEERIRNGPACR